MTLAVTAGGSGASNSSTATLAYNCNLTVAVGDLIVVVVGSDNATSGGATSVVSVTTAVGNTFHFPANSGERGDGRGIWHLDDPGAANAGATVHIAICEATVAMSATDQITVNYSPNTTAKSSHCYKVTKAADQIWCWPDGSTSNNDSGANPSLTTTANVEVGDVTFGAIGRESSGTPTGDSDTTNGSWAAIVTTQSGGTMLCASQYKIQTTAASTQTYNVTLADSDGCIAVYVIGERNAKPASVVVNRPAWQRANHW